jgi:ABC-type dipeptide/oligopeptide/nickel transport system permease component
VWAYILRRLAIMPLLLLGIVTVAFMITRLIPADPLITIVGERNMNNTVVVNAAKARWGLDKSIPEQYVLYLRNVAKGDLGTSFRTKTSVTSDLGDRLPATLELTLAALFIGTGGGILLGVVAAKRRDKAADHGARLFALLGSSLPVFWIGLLLLYVFYTRLKWLPGPGRLDTRSVPPPDVTGFYTIDSLLDGDVSTFWEATRHLLLPAFAIGWTLIGIISRLVRASVLDELNMDYIRTARAKGLRERDVLRGHALRNALLPTLTIVGFSFAAVLLTQAVLAETIFNWNGIGSYAVEATRQLDFPAITGVCLLGGAVFLLTNLATDVAYAVADPRVRLS